jgi:DNA uptake protein ComE-like DNA-binding protein
MTPPPRERLILTWRRPQQAALLAVTVLGWAVLAWAFCGSSVAVNDAPPVDRVKVRQAQERIDPNTACFASLRRLPRMGRSLAAAVIAYRASHGPVAFGRAEDLHRVRGIGPVLIAQARSMLSLPDGDESAWQDEDAPP